MYVVPNYTVAVIFCVITMICWGSWANTQKLAGKRWRFELFYWDYVFGMLLMALVFAFTLGSMGSEGRSFLVDIRQAEIKSFLLAMLSGAIFNAANILIVAAIAISGMAVAFPVGIGLALLTGTAVTYWTKPEGNPVVLGLGVALITVAIVLDALAYRRLSKGGQGSIMKGLLISIVGGLLMGNFYPALAASMSESATPTAGLFTPYSAIVVFSVGVLLSNFVFNTAVMYKPFIGTPVSPMEYFKGTPQDHLWGVVGGSIWAVGTALSILAPAKAGFPISYSLGQGAVMVAAFWGVFVWREFRAAPKGTNAILAAMFISFITGLGVITWAKNVGDEAKAKPEPAKAAVQATAETKGPQS